MTGLLPYCDAFQAEVYFYIIIQKHQADEEVFPETFDDISP